MQEGKEFYLTIRGKKVTVSEEVYRAYTRPIRSEQRQKRRAWKCQRLSEKGSYYVRCKERCENCPYYLAGNTALGNVTSLDRLLDSEVEIEDKNTDLETDYIERESAEEEYAKLYFAIGKLTKRQQELITLIYFEGKTQKQVANILKIDSSSVRHAMKRIKLTLKKILEES